MFGVAVPGTVYALVVGINNYPGSKPLPPAWWDGWQSPLRVGTCLAVISGFSEHLGEAGAGDVAVFYFAGHGSYETVDERFWFLESSGRNQTLVCADSRHDGIPDLGRS